MAKKMKTMAGAFHVDWLLFAIAFTILGLGYVMVVSASLHLGAKFSGNSMYYPLRQLIHIVAGLIAGFMVALTPLRTWKQYGPLLFVIGLGLLVLVLIPGIGIKVNGSWRWISIFGVRIQASEVMKLFSVIYIASYVERHKQAVQKAAFSLLKPLMLFSIACVLLLLEPDFGSSVVIITIVMGVMYLAGARLGQFVLLIAGVGALGRFLIYSSPYRLARVTSFLDPWADAQDKGFQLVQALIAFGRGEVYGVGLGSGIQKIFYLPEAHTDFLLSVLAEELGLIGVLSVVFLFGCFILRAFLIGMKAEKIGLRFEAFIAYGLGIWFGFQAFINMGVNMGMLPTKGLTLPLMSYGGGSMIIMCVAVALLFRVHTEVAEHMLTVPKGREEWIKE
jgi:cell division protein FtsW